MSSFSTKCYYLPLSAGLIYIVLNSNPVERELSKEIPDNVYRHITKGLILVVLIFIICRIIDINEKPEPQEPQEPIVFSCNWCKNDNYILK